MTDLDTFVRVLALEVDALQAGAAEARRQFGLADLTDEAVLGSTVYIWAAICAAQAIEAQRAATENTGAVHESAVPKGNAP